MNKIYKKWEFLGHFDTAYFYTWVNWSNFTHKFPAENKPSHKYPNLSLYLEYNKTRVKKANIFYA